jgi:hypothetical protein
MERISEKSWWAEVLVAFGVTGGVTVKESIDVVDFGSSDAG